MQTPKIQVQEYRKDSYRITTDSSRFDIGAIQTYLSKESYWSKGISLVTLRKALQNSLGFAMLYRVEQIGFARVVTDYATFAYLADVYILKEYRKQGLSKWLLECILEHPDLQNLRRLLLVTADAHSLYAKYGFTALENPDRFMEIHSPYE